MRRALARVAALVLAATAIPVAAEPARPRMSAAEFLQRGEARLALGPDAPWMSERDPLISESAAIVRGWTSDFERARRARRTHLGCHDPTRENGITTHDWLAAIRAMPPARRRTTTARAVFHQLMRDRFPCR